jgi:hypothetical protein
MKSYKPFIIFTIIVLLVSALFYIFVIPKHNNYNQLEQAKIEKNARFGYIFSKIDKLTKSLPINQNVILTQVDISNNTPASTYKGPNNTIILEINKFYFEQYSTDSLMFLKKVLSHEFSHIITLQDNQFKEITKSKDFTREEYLKGESNCRPFFYNNYGCFAQYSLITRFYNQFWTDQLKTDYDQIQNTEYDDKEIFNKEMQEWGEKYKDNFASKISIESPEEDFAEIFSFWVLNLPLEFTPSNTVKNKLKFMDEQPELVGFKNFFNAEFDKIFSDIPHSL